MTDLGYLDLNALPNELDCAHALRDKLASERHSSCGEMTGRVSASGAVALGESVCAETHEKCRGMPNGGAKKMC
jgi:hypothetical protein